MFFIIAIVTVADDAPARLSRNQISKKVFTTKDTKCTKFGILIIRNLRDLRGEWDLYSYAHAVSLPCQRSEQRAKTIDLRLYPKRLERFPDLSH